MWAWLASRGARVLIRQIASAVDRKATAGTDSERIAAELEEKRLETQLRALESGNALRMSMGGNWGLRVAVGMLSIATVAHYAAVCFVSAFPGAFPGWTVHALPDPMDDWQGAILLALLGISAGRMGVGVWAGRSQG